MAITRRRLISGFGTFLSGIGAASLLPAALAGASTGARPSGPIRIGIVSDASGDLAVYGKAEQRGIRLAIDQVNAAGGVLGRRIEPQFADTQTRPAAAARAARQLIEQSGVKALIGGVSSGLSGAIAEVAEEHNLVYLDTNSRSPTLIADHCVSVRFTFSPDSTLLARATVLNVHRVFGDRWYLVYEDSLWGQRSADFRRAVIEAAGGTVLGEAVVALDGSNAATVVSRVLNSGVDAASCALGAALLSSVEDAARAEGGDHRMAWVRPIVDWPDTAEPESKNLFGVFPLTWYWRLQAAGVPELVRAFWDAFPHAPRKMPGNLTHNGHMAAKALFSAMERAESVETAALVRQLEGMAFSPRQRAQHGRAWMDAETHALRQPVYLATSNDAPVHDDDLFRILTWTGAEDLHDPDRKAGCRVVGPET
ncbi:MAG: ABC transporter substrate-binding protein [Rhodospirillales bacterium]|nr:ABC transporter substrate-binding protein [Rhodospirillales bacterium]